MNARVVRISAKTNARERAPANLSQRCFLSIIGVLGGFMALVQGMIVVQRLPVTTAEDITIYWTVAALGIWVPAICLVASIIGVMIRDRMAMGLLVLSPVASIGGYFFYTYGPVLTIFHP